MNTKSFIIILYTVGLYHTAFSKFPSDVEQCHYEEDECLKRVIDFIFHNSFSGHKGLNLPSIDPLLVNTIDIKQGGESPVNIELKLKNTQVLGLSKSMTVKTTGFGKEINGSKHSLHIKVPIVYLLSDYSINGKVLILPIQGDGKSNLTTTDYDAFIKFTTKSTIVNNKEYASVDKIKLQFDTSRVYMNFENLYKGDKLLGDNTNLFLNENWQDIFNELKANIFDAFGLVFKNVINNVFAKIPYHELFKPE